MSDQAYTLGTFTGDLLHCPVCGRSTKFLGHSVSVGEHRGPKGGVLTFCDWMCVAHYGLRRERARKAA